MSSSIPYDPSLVLGNIVPLEHLDKLEKIATLQSPIDAALNELNSAILTRRKLDMTMDELLNLGVDTSKVSSQMKKINDEIKSAAGTFASTSATNLPEIAKVQGTLKAVNDSIESPIDYNRSQVKRMPLAADSMTMDAQYFSFDQNVQSSNSAMASMKSFISASTSFLGDKYSGKATQSAMSQVSHQREVHDIQGTLVITASCTHKQTSIFAPFFIDVDKGIRAWNQLFPDQMIKTNDPSSIAKIAENQQTKFDAKHVINLLSGATYGSSFVGMVHVLRESGTQSDQDMYSVAESLQSSMHIGEWFADYDGAFGVSSSFANSAKSLLSQQKITSHVSLVTMGIIPTIEANDIAVAVKEFSDFSPDKMMGELAELQNATASEQASISDTAEKARTGGQLQSIKAAQIKSVVSAVAEHQDASNKMLDINSLMTAFTDFVQKAAAGEAGVPITYFLKPITQSQLAQMWVAKYFPRKYVTSAGDDSKPEEPKSKDDNSNDSGGEGGGD